MIDSLGDRMKMYEGQESDRRFMPLLPIMARLDGRAFHSFCRHMAKPYDTDMMDAMAATTIYLLEETQAVIGYTQSDEISLVYYSDDIKSQVFMDSRIMKMTSILAAMATIRFGERMREYAKGAGSVPMFDCRVWTVPTMTEAANTLLWRERDATRNSINAAGQAHFSHKALQHKSTDDVVEMLHGKGVQWSDYPADFKRGQWFQKRRVMRAFTTDEIERLPPKHEARTNPGLQIERTDIFRIAMPPFDRVVNKVGVIFNGETPVLRSDNG